MIFDKKYKRYLFLKHKLNFVYKGVQYNKVLAVDIARFAFNQDKPKSIIQIVFNLFFSLDVRPLIKIFDTNDKLIVYSIDREDYKFQVEQVKSCISSAESILLSNLKKKTAVKPLRIISVFFFVYKRLQKEENLSAIFFLTSRIIYYRSIHDQLLSNYKVKPDRNLKFIAFNSAYIDENLLSQFFRLNNCSTFTLSHGFFVEYKHFIPLEIITGENIESDKILVWGAESSKDLQENFKFPKERIFVAGNSKYPSKKLDIKQTFTKGLVLLGRLVYEESNLEIVNIIKEFIKEEPNIIFNLKLHPSLNNEFYIDLCRGTNVNVIEGNKSLVETFKEQDYDFSIVNNSTAYYEAMYYDMICLRYLPSENEKFKGLKDKFSDSVSLKECIEIFKKIDNVKLNNEVEALLVSTLGMGINNYKEILD